MGITVKNAVALPESALQAIEQRMKSLTESGVSAAQDHTGEMNFSGCASGYCQAWA